MKYSVNQHWDPLKVCAVGKSYAPEFYSWITNSKARTVMERIAEETEEDYQKVIALLKSFDIEIHRPYVSTDYKNYLDYNGKIVPPPMVPRDYTAMIGNRFFYNFHDLMIKWDVIKGESWGDRPESPKDIPQWILDEAFNQFGISDPGSHHFGWKGILDSLEDKCELVKEKNTVNGAFTTRIGKDLYHGTNDKRDDFKPILSERQALFPDHRNHIVNSGGHSDGIFCPVKPGLILSLRDVQAYSETFPGWEVVYLPEQSWGKIPEFLDLKIKNEGKWWVPGEETNDEFTDYVNEWMGHWVGYVEETVFDVNVLVINEQNVVVNNYNKEVFEAFDRHGITPHIINFRHRYFWDGGLHCITSDLNRIGEQKDYFPNRGNQQIEI
jgi:N-dimethylarginine dimethylaminohydrolase